MTQLSAGTEDREAHIVAARSMTVNKPRHPGRRRPLHGDSPAQLPILIDEHSVPVISADSDMWEDGRAAARAGFHERAMTCFISEAEARNEQGSHGRAAISFRMAAEQARLQGLSEKGGQLLYSAAAAYAHAAERDALSPAAVHQAWISAAKCYLHVQELDRAKLCLEEARRVAEGTHRRVDQAQPAS